MVFGAFSLLLIDDEGTKKEYETAVSTAEDYMKRGLYQLAIAEYDKAIAIKDSEKLRDAAFDAYEKRYEESATILDSYVSAAESAVSAYPKNEKYYMILSKAYTRSDNHQSAYKIMEQAKQNGLNSKELNELYIDVKYAFETKWYTYNSFLPCTGGLYPTSNSEMWGYIDEEGNGKTGYDYFFASQLGDEGIRLAIGEQKILIDENDVVRGKISFVPTAAGKFSEGLIAINNGESFGYYNSLGDFQFGKYIKASNFQNGIAFVSEKDGEWFSINKDGKKTKDASFQDVYLNSDGSYSIGGKSIVKRDGKYQIVDESFKQVGKFECTNIDILTADGLIAFENNGKWGFVNTSGEIVIEPKFDKAKSFSNGLAAVCTNDKWGFIDDSGSIVIDCQFFDADYFNSKMNCLVKTTTGDWQMIALRVKF